MPVLEVIVRPRVFPDIRPGDAQPASADANPGAGRAIIGGGGGQVIDLNYDFQSRTAKKYTSEEYRVYDIIRIYRFIPDNPNTPPSEPQPGTVDREVYIDQEVMWQVIHVMHTGERRRTIYRKPDPEDYPNGNMEVIEEDIIRKTKGPNTLVDLVLP